MLNFSIWYNAIILEFIERDILWTIDYTDIQMEIDDNTQFHLLIEVDGDDMEKLYKDCELISDVLQKYECGEILLARFIYSKRKSLEIKKVCE